MAAKTKSSGLLSFILAILIGLIAQALVWRPQDPTSWAQVLASRGNFSMVLGWILFAVGGYLLSRSWVESEGEIAAVSGPRRLPFYMEASLFSCIMLLALLLRVYGLDHYPNAGFRDEGENGNVAIQLMNGEVVDGTDQALPVYVEHNTQNATAYFYPTALFFKLFGISIYSERLVSVLFGVISVAAFYFLARWLFGVPLGLVLAALLATLRWHINFSRIGFLGIMTLFYELPLFYFLLKGLKRDAGNALKKLSGPFLGFGLALVILRGLLAFIPALQVPEIIGFNFDFFVGLLLSVPFLICAWRARKDPRSRDLMLAAAVLALAMYSYIAARLLILIVGAVVLREILGGKGGLEPGARRGLGIAAVIGILGLILIVTGSVESSHGILVFGKLLMLLGALIGAAQCWMLRERFGPWIKPLALALGVGLVVAGPLFAYTLSHWTEINARSDRVSIYNDKEFDKRPWGQKLLEEVPLTLGMYNVRGDGNPRHNLPDEIMLNPLWAALFGLAIFYCLLHLFDERSWLVLSWWQVSLLAGYLSIEAPQAYRTIAAMPAILIGIGLVLERGVIALRRAWGKSWVMPGAVILLLFVAIGAAYEIDTYFVAQAQHPGVWAEFSASEYLMGQELKAAQAQGPTLGLVKPDWADSYTFRFMTYPERNYQYFDVSQDVPLKSFVDAPNQRYMYILGDTYIPLLSILKNYYPKGVYHEVRHPMTNELLYWTYTITAEDAKGASIKGGLNGRYYQDVPANEDKPELAAHWMPNLLRHKQVDPFLLFDWVVSPVPGFFSAEWAGHIKAPKGGLYHFYLDSNSYALLEIDGKKVAEMSFDPAGQSMIPGTIQLLPGWHSIRVRYYEARNYARLSLWWQIPGGEREVVSSQYLKEN